MSKTGPELRHEAKQRMEKYRLEMISKGFFSTTIFLSQEHRDELKRLGEEHRLTRAEAAEHIFKVYLESENKDITQTHNTSMDNQTETIAIIEDMKDRLRVLEEKWSKQAEGIEGSVSVVKGVHLQNEVDNKDKTQTDNTNDEYQIEPPDAMPEAKVKNIQGKDQTPAVEPSGDVSNKDATQTNNTNTKEPPEVPIIPDIEPTAKQIRESQAEMFDTGQEPVKPKPDQNMELPDYLVDIKPDMPIEERHKIILRLAEDFPGRGKGSIGNAQKRIDMLNAAGVLLNGKPWEKPKQFADQLSIARRWTKKQERKK